MLFANSFLKIKIQQIHNWDSVWIADLNWHLFNNKFHYEISFLKWLSTGYLDTHLAKSLSFIENKGKSSYSMQLSLHLYFLAEQWMTVRYLQCAVFLFVSLGSLTSDSSNLFGTLDLGGGSTQITLSPVDQVNTAVLVLVGLELLLSF